MISLVLKDKWQLAEVSPGLFMPIHASVGDEALIQASTPRLDVTGVGVNGGGAPWVVLNLMFQNSMM